MESFNRDQYRFAEWLKQHDISAPIEPRPENVRRATANFKFEHGHSPITEDERAECYRLAQGDALLDVYATFKEHDQQSKPA